MINRDNNSLKRFIVGMVAVIMTMSAAGCSSSDTPDSEKADKEETTTTTTAAEAEGSEESEETKDTEAPEEEKETEETSETPAVTTVPEDFDAQLDAMMSSIEAEIPDITVYSGLGSSSKPETDSQSAGGEATTTTTTTAKPDTNAPVAADLKSEQQLVFDGKTYDNSTFTSEGISAPSGWSVGSSDKQYENPAYPDSYIVAGQSKGASFMIPDAKKKGETALPSLQLYKGLTWGASADDIKAAYGTPVKESNTESYGSSMTNLWYKSSDGALVVYEVSADWGLVVVDCFGK